MAGTNDSPLSQRIGLVLGPVLFAGIYWGPQIGLISLDAQKVLALTAWMLAWWLTEAMPLPVTALLPLAIFPIMGIKGLTFDKAAQPYSNKVIFLFLGGFVLAYAMEKWKLHLRIAISIVRATGTSANGIVLGFILATGFLSAWISNTATAVMMLPIATSVVKLLLDQRGKNDEDSRKFALSLMLSIAYAASVGGVATLVGTPPNAVFSSYISERHQISVSFMEWSKWAAPFAIAMLFITYFMLTKVLFRNQIGRFEGAETLIEEEWKKLGKMQGGELYVFIIFIATALAWLLRDAVHTYIIPMPGVSDYNIAIASSIALFCTPVNWKKGEFLLTGDTLDKLPWGILLLFGGGLCLADRLDEVGLVALIGEAVSSMKDMHPLLLLAFMLTSVVFLSELLSNVALITLFMPIVGGVAAGTGYDLVMLAMPVAMAGSSAFMLPMGTPPNAIVFASGHIKFAEMAKAGFWLNLIGIALLLVMSALMMWLGTGVS